MSGLQARPTGSPGGASGGKRRSSKFREAASSLRGHAAPLSAPAAIGWAEDAANRPFDELAVAARRVRALTWYVEDAATAQALPELIRRLRAADRRYPGVQLIVYGPELRPQAMRRIADNGGTCFPPRAFGTAQPADGTGLARKVAALLRRASRSLGPAP